MNSNIVSLLIGVFSLIITIIIFMYQENKESKKISREVQIFTEDIITQIVRNTTQQKISFLSVNISHFIEGFAKLNDISIHYTITDLLKMVYTRVYENDYIDKSDKISVLEEIEDKLAEEERGYDTNHRFARNFIKVKKKQSSVRLILYVIIAYIVSIIITNILTDDGQSTYLELVFNIYSIIGVFLLIIFTLLYISIVMEIRRLNNAYFFEQRFNDGLERENHIHIRPQFASKTNDEGRIDLGDGLNNTSIFEILSDEKSKILLAENVMLRIYLNDSLNKMMAKFPFKDINIRRADHTMHLRKILSHIENKNLLEGRVVDELNKAYYTIQEYRRALNDIVHFNNTTYLYTSEEIQSMKNKIDEYVKLFSENFTGLNFNEF